VVQEVVEAGTTGGMLKIWRCRKYSSLQVHLKEIMEDRRFKPRRSIHGDYSRRRWWSNCSCRIQMLVQQIQILQADGGDGGAGATTSISGSPTITYAGGGGGGTDGPPLCRTWWNRWWWKGGSKDLATLELQELLTLVVVAVEVVELVLWW
jgi:hypothetical protein